MSLLVGCFVAKDQASYGDGSDQLELDWERAFNENPGSVRLSV
jgi:hypothetical protein